MKLLFIVDPLAGLKHYKDSSVAMMRAAARRGHAVFACQARDLMMREQRVCVHAVALTVRAGADWYGEGAVATQALTEFDAVLMRTDPPVDADYLAATHLLSLAEAQGARVFNRASSLRDFNEKLAIFRFPQFIAPTLVSADAAQIGAFLAAQGDVIIKPLHGMGGQGVFRVTPSDPNRNAILETLTGYGRHLVMAQRYLPAITQGDKRILLIAGVPIPYVLARIPQAGETRGNLAAGGRGEARPLGARDAEIAHAVGAAALEAGLFLVGLDVIGEHLTEVNVTSPTGFQEITAQTGYDVADHFIAALETRCA